MYRVIGLVLGGCLAASLGMAQFGGKPGDVVIYAVTAKGSAAINVVPAGRTNTASGYQVIDTPKQLTTPFGPNFPGEFFVTLHTEPGDSFRFIIQKEGIETQLNTFSAAGKLFIAEGVDRLLIPNKKPFDLTAGLFAPFPATVDFGPELPEFEARSFLWTASPTFPLLQPAPPGYKSPITPAGLTGSEYVLSLGTPVALLPWVGLNFTYPGQGWKQGTDIRPIEQDGVAGTVIRMIRLRPGKVTPAFTFTGNTHLAVLQGSVTLTPTSGAPASTLTKFQYAFIPNGYSIVLSNPAVYSGPTSDFNPFYPYPNPFNPVK